ncbi:chorismate mutase, partial [bacterium]|nr:chorismate mutase [bacterium]
MGRLQELRDRIDVVNGRILELLQERGRIVLEIASDKGARGLAGYDPRREEKMLAELTKDASGPFGPGPIRDVFRQVFRISLELMDREHQVSLRVRQP